jgi:AcrR family transcriptional regulator
MGYRAVSRDRQVETRVGGHRKPVQERSQKTYELLLQAAETLLEEVGIERISTNLICQRASMTAPAFYRYFDDKYAVIEALAERLMARQNSALVAWIDRYRDQGYDALVSRVSDLVREMDEITRGQPGSIWIIRALRAVPSLSHIRLASHNYVTDLLTDLYGRYLPDVPREHVRRRTRLAVEIAYSIDEMLKEESVSREETFADLTFIFRAMFYHPDLGVIAPEARASVA